MAFHLGRCRFLPGTFDKRWAREISAEAERQFPEISHKEAELLRTRVHRYRRQIPADVVDLAGTVTPPVPQAVKSRQGPQTTLFLVEEG
jgi:hypothetical protein